MLVDLARYVRHLPSVLRKLAVLHRHGVLLDEANPEQLNKSLRAWRIYKRGHGYLRALVQEECVDAEGRPIPWYTYPAIEQLSKWVFSQCDILEYGCGNSTLWWAARARSVVSIESSRTWHDRVKAGMPDNCRLVLSDVNAETPEADAIETYIRVVESLGQFDVVVVDGVNRPGVRRRCMEAALPHLRRGGLLIIDNSDWLPETCRRAREAGFREVDFSGLSPLNDMAETTSLFFTADLRIAPAREVHPGSAIGGYDWNRDCDLYSALDARAAAQGE